MRVLTIGHSNHSLETFLALLEQHGVQLVVDVRSYPVSKYVPHFSASALAPALAERGIDYAFLGKQLGGRPSDRSLYDTRGRVDHARLAGTPDFGVGIELLLQMGAQRQIAILCSEENPALCHRRVLVGAALRERQVTIEHIRGDSRVITDDDVALAARGVGPSAQRRRLFEEQAAYQREAPWACCG